MKKCTKCGVEKPLNEFYFSSKINYYQASCKKCMAAVSKKRRARLLKRSYLEIDIPRTKVCPLCGEEKESVAFYIGKRYTNGLSSYCRVCGAKNGRRNKVLQQKENPIKTLVTEQIRRLRHRAKKNDWPFDLDSAFLCGLYASESICQCCGTKMTLPILGTRESTVMSIDRLDSNKGYTKENIRIICDRCNTIKNFGTAEDHEMVAAWIRREQSCD